MLKFLEENLAAIINKKILPRLSKNGSGCWRYTGYSDKDGYGRLSIKMPPDGRVKNFYIHRLLFAFYKGSIPRNKEIHHTCDHRDCGNPEHLELKTRQQNMAERWGTAGQAIEVKKS